VEELEPTGSIEREQDQEVAIMASSGEEEEREEGIEIKREVHKG